MLVHFDNKSRLNVDSLLLFFNSIQCTLLLPEPRNKQEHSTSFSLVHHWLAVKFPPNLKLRLPPDHFAVFMPMDQQGLKPVTVEAGKIKCEFHKEIVVSS